MTDDRLSKCPRIQLEKIDATSLKRDPRLCLQIWEFHITLQDEI